MRGATVSIYLSQYHLAFLRAVAKSRGCSLSRAATLSIQGHMDSIDTGQTAYERAVVMLRQLKEKADELTLLTFGKQANAEEEAG